MGSRDHYVFIDGCVVKGCRSVIDFTTTFGQYAALLQTLFTQGGWGRGGRRMLGLPLGIPFRTWVQTHVHITQSTQNLRTGASRVAAILEEIQGDVRVHLFGTSAGGSAILEYFLLTDPQRLYYYARDPRRTRVPARRYQVDSRVASICMIDAPTGWVPLRPDRIPILDAQSAESLGRYLAATTRVQAGPGVPDDQQTVRNEDVPGTWIAAEPIAGTAYDNTPHFAYLPGVGIERHIYTGSHMSEETRDFLSQAWR